MKTRMTIALVAHDNMKRDLAEWVAWNWESLLTHRLVCTGTTGRIVAETLMARRSKEAANARFDITMLKSGPLGGDQQLGAMIAGGEIDMLINPHQMERKRPKGLCFCGRKRFQTVFFKCFAEDGLKFTKFHGKPPCY